MVVETDCLYFGIFEKDLWVRRKILWNWNSLENKLFKQIIDQKSAS